MAKALASRLFRSQARWREEVLCIALVVAAFACVAAPASAAASNAEKTKLRALAVKSARSLGDKHPTDLEAVKTTYTAYRKAFSGPPARVKVSKIWAVELHGHFKLGPQTYPWEVLIVRASDNQLAFAIAGGPKTPDLSKLGRVVKLSQA